MADFNQMVIPFIIFLIAINTIFAAVSQIPATQNMSAGQNLFGTLVDNNDINSSIYTYTNTINYDINQAANGSDANSVSLNVNPLDVTSLIFGALDSVTGGGLTAVTKFIGFVGQMSFGYNTWIDYFFKPEWGAFVTLLGGIFKGFFFIIQLYGVVYIVMSLLGRTI